MNHGTLDFLPEHRICGFPLNLPEGTANQGSCIAVFRFKEGNQYAGGSVVSNSFKPVDYNRLNKFLCDECFTKVWDSNRVGNIAQFEGSVRVILVGSRSLDLLAQLSAYVF